jgi:hypothetical protein
LEDGSGDTEEWLRGERRAAGGSIAGEGELRTRCTGAGPVCMSAGGSAGEERHDKSIESIVCEIALFSVGCGFDRSRVSISGDVDFVFCKRGDVRRPREAGAVSFELLRVLIRDGPECDESEEEFEDMEFRGGRATIGAGARREFVVTAGYDLDGTIRAGEDRVKSNSSTTFTDG